MIRVLIADDHALIRDGLRHILQSSGRCEVVAEAADGPSALQMARQHAADLILLDLSMPGRNGLDLIKQLREDCPKLRVLVFTMHAEEQYAIRAFKAGAAGYLTKESAADELMNAVTKVAAGGVYISLAMAEQYAQSLTGGQNQGLPHESLSDREYDVCRRLVAGESISQIADALYVSPKTVSTYKARIFEKLQVQSDAALVRYAIKHGLFEEGAA